MNRENKVSEDSEAAQRGTSETPGIYGNYRYWKCLKGRGHTGISTRMFPLINVLKVATGVNHTDTNILLSRANLGVKEELGLT